MFKDIDIEMPRVAGLYHVILHGKSLDIMKRGAVDIAYYKSLNIPGSEGVGIKIEEGLSGIVAVYKEGILSKSYNKPWQVQLKMLEEKNAEFQRENPSWKIIFPPNAATAVEVAQEVWDKHNINVLPKDTRVGDGSVSVGFNPNPSRGFGVTFGISPDQPIRFVGVLPLVVPK